MKKLLLITLLITSVFGIDPGWDSTPTVQNFGIPDTLDVATIIATGTITSGDITISDATPSLSYKDTDGIDSDVNAYIDVNLSDTGTGTEDGDLQIYQQVAGTALRTLFSDADVGIWLYPVGSSTNFLAITANEARLSSATPSIDWYDTDGGDGDVSVSIDVDLTDTGTGAEDADVTIQQKVAGTLTTFLFADADGTLQLGTASQNTDVLGTLFVAGDQINSDDLSDVTSIFMLDENETVTGAPIFSNATTALTIGAGAVGVDYRILFDGETFDGTITFMEDEDRWDFDNDVDVIANLTAGTIASGATITANSNYVLEGYSTGRNVLRKLTISISNATTAGNYIKAISPASVALNWNASDIAIEDDLLLGTTGSRFFYGPSSADQRILILDAAIDGTLIAVISINILRNQSTTELDVTAIKTGSNIQLDFYLQSSGASTTDLDLLVDTGAIQVEILYVTSS